MTLSAVYTGKSMVCPRWQSSFSFLMLYCCTSTPAASLWGPGMSEEPRLSDMNNKAEMFSPFTYPQCLESARWHQKEYNREIKEAPVCYHGTVLLTSQGWHCTVTSERWHCIAPSQEWNCTVHREKKSLYCLPGHDGTALLLAKDGTALLTTQEWPC